MSNEYIKIYGQLHSVETRHVLADASEIYDSTQEKTQSEINAGKANINGDIGQYFSAKAIKVLGKGTGNGVHLYRTDGRVPYARIITDDDITTESNVGIDFQLPVKNTPVGSTVTLALRSDIPDVSSYVTNTDLNTALAGKQPVIDAQNKLDYSLLDNTPTIPTVPTISTDITADAASDTKTVSPKAVKTYADTKQNALVSGTNIKTINNETLLGSGNITVGGISVDITGTVLILS